MADLLPCSSVASVSPKEGAKVPVLKPTFCGLQSSPVKPQAAEVGFHVAHAGVNHILPSSQDPNFPAASPELCATSACQARGSCSFIKKQRAQNRNKY